MNDHRERRPNTNTNPAYATKLFARLLNDSPALFTRADVAVGPPYYLPVGTPLIEQHRCCRREDAEKVRLESDYDAAAKREADYVRRLDADRARLAKEARAAAALLCAAGLTYGDLLAMARKLELPVADWSGAYRDFEAVRPALEAADCQRLATAGAAKAIHADDFSSVNWLGQQHTFTKSQASAVRMLWEAWERGLAGVRQTAIGGAVGSAANTYRLVHTFRNHKTGKYHAAWGTMIRPVEGQAGMFCLCAESRKDHTGGHRTRTPTRRQSGHGKRKANRELA